MRTRHKWTQEQKAGAVAGASVVAQQGDSDSTRRRVILAVEDGGLQLEGMWAAWHHCDPSTLSQPVDPRQLGLFGGGK